MLILFGLIPFARLFSFTNFTSGDDTVVGNSQTKSTLDRCAALKKTIQRYSTQRQMTIITSKRHPIKFYAVIIFVSLFIAALGTLILFVSIDLLQKENPDTKNYFLPFFSFIFYFLAFSMVYAYWKNSPKVTIDNHTITFGNERFYLKDIKKVTLTGKMPFKLIIRFPMEGTALIFIDGTEKYFFDDLFSNSWEIKSFLEQTVIKKEEYIPTQIEKVDSNMIRFERFETFKGAQITSLRGIMLWGLIGIFAFLLISKTQSASKGFLIFLLVSGTFWFLINSWLMHFFCITNEYFIVKNHNFVWVAKIYRIKDIAEIVYEAQGNQPNSLRIITKDFKNKIYPAGTLRDKTWLEMKSRLEMKGVKVRNECIPEE